MDLVWCTDFNAALAERQRGRKCETDSRANYVMSDAEESSPAPDVHAQDAATQSLRVER